MFEDAGADPLFRPVAKHPLDRRALVADDTVGFEDHNDIRSVLDQGPEPLLARLQRFLGTSALPSLFSFAHRTTDRRNKAFQAMLQHVVRSAAFKDLDRPLFPQ